jgi:hypothetical protein
VKKVVHKADQRLSLFSDQRMHRLKAIEEAPPSHLLTSSGMVREKV